MVKEIKYTTIGRVLDNIMDHPLMRDVTLEQVVKWAVRFIGMFGFSKFYTDKIEEVDITEYRGSLPCDLVSVNQVRDCKTGVCLRSMTDTFYNDANKKFGYGELAFKVQGRVIFTSFPEGTIKISYKAMPVDDEGFPLIIDNENYLAALEAYIKERVFTVKFETGKVSLPVLRNAQEEYTLLAAALKAEFTTPSVSEVEAYTRMFNTLIPRMREFDKGFKTLGNREYLRKH